MSARCPVRVDGEQVSERSRLDFARIAFSSFRFLPDMVCPILMGGRLTKGLCEGGGRSATLAPSIPRGGELGGTGLTKWADREPRPRRTLFLAGLSDSGACLEQSISEPNVARPTGLQARPNPGRRRLGHPPVAVAGTP